MVFNMENDSKVIVVNATALSSGGALTILRQFIAHAEISKKKFIIFIPTNVKLKPCPNIKYVKIDTKSWVRRIWWDFIGLKSELKKRSVKYSLCISLQNTSVNIDCEQLIYLHQSLPFTTVRYSFNKETVKYFLYKWFYKLFIFLFSSTETRFVVQTRWMKAALLQNGVLEERISIFTPDIKLPTGYDANCRGGGAKSVNNDKATFFYPASPLFYKNHLMILDALSILKKQPLNKVPIFAVTFKPGDYPVFDEKAKQLDLIDNISYLGVLPYDKVIEKYIFADAVLFPSYIETFGLPLAEAGVLGKKIICADLPYSRDVLDDYQGATFLDYQNAKLWASVICDVIHQSSMSQYSPLSFSQCATWQDFFDFI